MSNSLLAEQKDIYLPPALETWEKWVSYENEKMFCPSTYNDAHGKVCVWPEILQIDATDSGATFSQKVTVFAESRLRLTGDRTLWPVSVKRDGAPAPILSEEGAPYVELARGKHLVSGTFVWDRLPGKITLPESATLVSLRINGEIVRAPFIDAQNHLWIKDRDGGEVREDKEKNMVGVSVFRLIEDDNPLKVQTRVRLRVSGERRREKLELVLLESSVAVSVDSPLPVKLDPDGSLWVEVKPGTWDITILSVVNSLVTSLGPSASPYGDEIWVFKPFPHIRVSRVEGPATIDPSQSRLPESWNRYTGYLMKKESLMRIVSERRGNPNATDHDMALTREMWLDFDGMGGTVRDRISGFVGRRKFIALDEKAYEPGSISLNGRDRLVTRYGRDSAGIEVERGELQLTSVSRVRGLASGKQVPTGWNLEFQSSSLKLHLPPGWHLFALSGGRAASGASWVDRWSMLDFFLILVVSFAVARLWRWWWGGIFLAGMVLTSHEPFSPQYVWPVLIVTSSLYRLFSEAETGPGKKQMKKLIAVLHLSTLLVLAGLVLAFSWVQIRSAVYPQLEPVEHWRFDRNYVKEARMETPSVQESFKKDREMARDALPRVMSDEESEPAKVTGRWARYSVPVEEAATQTGPGIPRWKWRLVPVAMGQISQNHGMAFWLSSPPLTSLIRWVRVFFIVVMVFGFAWTLRPVLRGRRAVGKALVFLLMALSVGMGRGDIAAAEIPSQAMLDELERRIEAPDACFPECASITYAEVFLPEAGTDVSGGNFVEIHLDINAAVDTAVPLPSGSGTWTLYDLEMDGLPHRAALRKSGNLWILVPAGVHKIQLRGYSGVRKRYRFLFPLNPSHVAVETPGWDISGLNEYHRVDNVLQAVMQVESAEGDDGALFFSDYGNVRTDFLRVTRTLKIGLEWRVRTRVERFVVTGEKKAVVVSLPLIKDEMVLTGVPGLSVADGRAHIELGPGQEQITWESSIPVQPSLSLKAEDDAWWAQVWNLQLSSMWHLDYHGIPVTYPEYGEGSFWYPFPGESIDLTFTRLKAATGESFTVDSVRADYYTGRGYNRTTLAAEIRTTEGSVYEIASPAGAIVGHVAINGKKVPVSEGQGRVSLSLAPGKQSVEVEWNQLTEETDSWFYRLLKPGVVAFPEIDMGREVNNIDIYIHIPQKLWLLFTHGPDMGPAVLLWSVAGVIVLAACILGRLPFSPLGTVSWLILGLGLVSLDVPSIVIIAAWFMAVEIRKTKTPLSPLWFNLMQLALVAGGVFVLWSFYRAVTAGLLDIPHMQVAGNGSGQTMLHWTLDKKSGILPRPWVAVYSVYIYQVVMLLWSLWLAVKTVSWAKWAAFSLKEGGGWRPLRLSKRAKKSKKC